MSTELENDVECFHRNYMECIMKEEKWKIQKKKKIRDLDNTMRKSNRHLIRVSGGQEGKKWAEVTTEKVIAMNLRQLMKDNKPQTEEEWGSQTKELTTNLYQDIS